MSETYHGQAAQDFFVIHMLKKKKNGYFLEIGSNNPINCNNTYKLEKEYGWRGIMVEYEPYFLPSYYEHRQNSIPIINDARQVDYAEELRKANFPKNMDYLQIDLDVDNESTLDVLKKFNNTVFNEYKFATVTFEHDIYRGDYFNTRAISRAIFEARGYVRIFSDVMISYDTFTDAAFEDWYVHPDLVDMEYVNHVKSEGRIHSHEIVKRLTAAFDKFQHKEQLTIPLSHGELLDRLSILDIKRKEIKQEDRLQEVEKELHTYRGFLNVKHTFQLYYKLISFVNKRIWDLTNTMKEMEIGHSDYATTSSLIFDYNQQRFRLKNIVNTIADSSIKEQKSYAIKTGFVSAFMESTTIMRDIIYCLLHYDTVEVYCHSLISDSFKHRIQVIFPTIRFVTEEHSSTLYKEDDQEVKYLHNYIQQECKEYLDPIFYIAGGRLGDFMLQLSVVQEQYLKTGRKGDIYMYDKIPNLRFEASFSNGLQSTYDDIYSLLMNQEYILDCKIWNKQHYDVNLSIWYNSPLLYHTNWYEIFKKEYDIEWGKKKWLHTQINENYKGSIVITPIVRNITIDLNKLLKKYDKSKMLFVCFDRTQYQLFSSIYGIELPVIECKTIEDMAIIINSCDLYISGMSSPLAIAQATHTNTIALLDYDIDSNHNLLEGIIPNYTIMR
jgi:hypothetical protein